LDHWPSRLAPMLENREGPLLLGAHFAFQPIAWFGVDIKTNLSRDAPKSREQTASGSNSCQRSTLCRHARQQTAEVASRRNPRAPQAQAAHRCSPATFPPKST
jgi:hypothetical protein